MDEKSVIAHRNASTGKTQSLVEHLLRTAELSKTYGEKVGLSNTSFLLGLLHDLGKADEVFQNYIRFDTKKHVNHSSAGGRFLMEYLISIKDTCGVDLKTTRLFMEIGSYVVFAHHGFFDCIDKEENVMTRRKNYESEGEYNYSRIAAFVEELNVYLKKLGYQKVEDYILLALEEFETLSQKIHHMSLKGHQEDRLQKEAKYFYNHLVVRLLLSILKEADIYDTTHWEEPESDVSIFDTDQIWSDGLQKIEEKYLNFSASTPLNRARNEMSERAKDASVVDSSGIYKVSVVTGGGKTYLTMRYALNHASFFQKERIYYITAFLSVLEQNVQVYRELLEADEWILEHHSNVVMEDFSKGDSEDTDTDYLYRQYLIDSWNSPYVFTTFVQFMNTLFKGKSSSIRRFSKLVNSVIILDEVQSMPKKLTHLFTLTQNFLKEVMNATILHCTATQPNFDSSYLTHPILYGNAQGKNEHLVSLTEEEKDIFKRVEFRWLKEEGDHSVQLSDLVDFIIQNSSSKSILTILNSKRTVKLLCEELCKKGIQNYYLTTNLCSAHRRERLEKIRAGLKEGEHVICISTALIEAGVDVDFDIVLKEVSGGPEALQAGGRANREGEKPLGYLYLFRLEENHGRLLREICEKCDAFDAEFRKIPSPICIEEHISAYYDVYYANAGDLDYPRKEGGSLLEALSINERKRTFSNGKIYKGPLAQDFKSAGKEFSVIDEEGDGVIVHYGESGKWISRLHEAIKEFDFHKMKILLKRLQPYTVQVHPNLRKSLQPYFEIEHELGFSVLMKEKYSEEFGILTDESISGTLFI